MEARKSAYVEELRAGTCVGVNEFVRHRACLMHHYQQKARDWLPSAVLPQQPRPTPNDVRAQTCMTHRLTPPSTSTPCLPSAVWLSGFLALVILADTVI